MATTKLTRPATQYHRMTTATLDTIMPYLRKTIMTPTLLSHISQHHQRSILCLITLPKNTNISTTTIMPLSFSLMTLMVQILKDSQATLIIMRGRLQNQLLTLPR